MDFQICGFRKTDYKIQKKYNISSFEVHNRPSYIFQLSKNIPKKIFSLYFHNDPLSMDGSKTIEERKKLLKICYKIIFNSNWSKKRFLEGLENKFVKLSSVPQTTLGLIIM